MFNFNFSYEIGAREGFFTFFGLVVGVVAGGVFTFLLLIDNRAENLAIEKCHYNRGLETEHDELKATHDACQINQKNLSTALANVTEKPPEAEKLILDSIELSDENRIKKKSFLLNEYVTVGETVEVDEREQTFTLSFRGQIFPGGYVEINQQNNPYKIAYANMEYLLDVSIDDNTRLFFKFSRVTP